MVAVVAAAAAVALTAEEEGDLEVVIVEVRGWRGRSLPSEKSWSAGSMVVGGSRGNSKSRKVGSMAREGIVIMQPRDLTLCVPMVTATRTRIYNTSLHLHGN